MKSKLLVILCLALVQSCASSKVYKLEEKELGYIMSVSRAEGACGMVGEIANFQQGAEVKGGDAFVTAFIEAEAKRTGLSVDDYIAKCATAQEEYKQAYSEVWL